MNISNEIHPRCFNDRNSINFFLPVVFTALLFVISAMLLFFYLNHYSIMADFASGTVNCLIISCLINVGLLSLLILSLYVRLNIFQSCILMNIMFATGFLQFVLALVIYTTHVKRISNKTLRKAIQYDMIYLFSSGLGLSLFALYTVIICYYTTDRFIVV